MKIKDLALLGADNARTRAYIQLLFNNSLQINKCYLMTDDTEKLEKQADSYQGTAVDSRFFNRDEPVVFTLKKYGVSWEYIITKDINSETCLELLKKVPESNLIYSGFGGQIIRPHIFNTGKTFIHVHSGVLPQYRGSTTVYYSLLNENFCGASGIVMTPGLDEGDVIAEERFPMPPRDIDIDYIYDPYIRAKVLVKAVQKYLETGAFSGHTQGIKNAKTYFIAHPILRHIVKLAQEAEEERN